MAKKEIKQAPAYNVAERLAVLLRANDATVEFIDGGDDRSVRVIGLDAETVERRTDLLRAIFRAPVEVAPHEDGGFTITLHPKVA